MGLFSFIKEAGEKLFGGKEVEAAVTKAATDAESVGQCALGRSRRSPKGGGHGAKRIARLIPSPMARRPYMPRRDKWKLSL